MPLARMALDGLDVLDVLPIPDCGRYVGISPVWVRLLVERGEVKAVRDRAGRLYIPMPEVKRLAARYAHRRAELVRA